MKRIFTLVLLAFFVYSLPAQITITASDVIPLGVKAIQTLDSIPDASIDEGGLGFQNWNFTTLKDFQQNDFEFLAAASTPYAGLFPSANLAAKLDTSGYLYFEFNDQALKMVGSYVQVPFDSATTLELGINITPGQSLIRFPATFGNSYTEATVQVIQIPGALVGFPFDSVRVVTTTQRSIAIDAYGTLSTPLANYEVIRSSELNESWDTTYILFSGFWQVVDAAEEPDSSYNYNFWTNTGTLGFPVAQLEFEPEFQGRSVTWLKEVVLGSTEQPVKIDLAVFPNPTADFLNITLGQPVRGTVELFDMNGHKLSSQPLDGQFAQLNISAHPQGTLLLVVNDQKGSLLTFKLVQKL